MIGVKMSSWLSIEDSTSLWLSLMLKGSENLLVLVTNKVLLETIVLEPFKALNYLEMFNEACSCS